MDDLLPPGEPADDLYFCVRPANASAAAIQTLGRSLGIGSPIRRATYHISLLRLGGLPGLRRDDLEAAATAVRNVRLERFPIHLDRLQSWKRTSGEWTIVLLAPREDDAALQWLAASIGMAVARSGVRSGGIPPRPHLTLAYDPVAMPAAALPKPIVIPATHVHLVRNHRGRGRLEELACYPLR